MTNQHTVCIKGYKQAQDTNETQEGKLFAYKTSTRLNILSAAALLRITPLNLIQDVATGRIPFHMQDGLSFYKTEIEDFIRESKQFSLTQHNAAA